MSFWNTLVSDWGEAARDTYKIIQTELTDMTKPFITDATDAARVAFGYEVQVPQVEGGESFNPGDEGKRGS